MTTLSSAERTSTRARVRPRLATTVPVVVLVAAGAAALLRVRYLGAPMSPDEGGFLAVAQQWGHGTSLYGDYWVDRPPLLVALFRLAAATGGLVSLRVLGCLATVVVVLATGLGVRRVAGTAAAGVAALVAGGLLVSPLLGAVAVNGELLAAPFVAVGTCLVVLAVAEDEARRQRWLAVGAGATGAAAVLVKQNMIDVAVFGVVLVLAAWATGHLDRVRVRRLVLGLGLGGVAAGAVVLLGALAAGTRPGEVLFAMYAFRVRAASVLDTVNVASRVEHLQYLLTHELLGFGVLPVLLLAALLLLRRGSARSTLAHPVGVATLALVAFDVVSVLMGGSYWTHYLVQLAVPTALAAGLSSRWVPRTAAVVAVPVLVSALLAWGLGQGVRVVDAGERLGTTIGAVAQPGDSIVTVLGGAELVESSGLRSPYPYLWTLPARTLDPRMAELGTVLSGPHRPTWVVLRGSSAVRLVDDHRRVGAALATSYHQVARACGHRVYLLDGATRPTPDLDAGCTTTLAGSLGPLDRSPR